MAITRTPIVNDDGTNSTGTVWENAWKQELYDQIDGAIGADLSPAWTNLGPLSWITDSQAITGVGHQLNMYRRIGANMIHWMGFFNPITIPGTTSGIYITTTPFIGTQAIAYFPISYSSFPAIMQYGGNRYVFKRYDGQNWAAGNIALAWSVTIDVVPF